MEACVAARKSMDGFVGSMNERLQVVRAATEWLLIEVGSKLKIEQIHAFEEILAAVDRATNELIAIRAINDALTYLDPVSVIP